MSSPGTPIQAVLSQADLVRIREHLRRRQEEWSERTAALVAGAGARGGPGAGAGPGVRGDSAGTGISGAASAPESRTTISRPTSAPALAQRPRASSVGALESPSGASRRGLLSGGDLSSREGSLGEMDPASALEVVHFMEEAMADEDYDEDGDGGHGEEGDDDEEDLAHLEPSEAGDSQGEATLGTRLGGLRSREGGDSDGAQPMEEELRVLEQLRVMEQVISEVLDPHEGGGGR